MTEPWFSPELAPWFSLFSLLAAMASLMRFAERGTHRNLVLSSWYAAIGFGALMLVAALVGLATGQPGFVVGTLAFTGAVVAAGFAFHLPRIAKLYREAELRGTIASDL